MRLPFLLTVSPDAGFTQRTAKPQIEILLFSVNNILSVGGHSPPYDAQYPAPYNHIFVSFLTKVVVLTIVFELIKDGFVKSPS